MLSADEDKSFQPTRIPSVTEVLRLEAIDDENFWVVGTNGQCTPGRYVTQDGGDTWQRSDGAASLWYMARDRSVPRVVHAPGRLTDTPCDPVSLSAVGNEVLRILCTNGDLIGTDDQGDSWVSLGSLPGAAAVRFTSLSEGYAVASQPTCSAAVLATIDGGLTWDQVTCLGGGQPRAVAAAGDIVAAQVDNSLRVSLGGGPWKQR